MKHVKISWQEQYEFMSDIAASGLTEWDDAWVKMTVLLHEKYGDYSRVSLDYEVMPQNKVNELVEFMQE